MLNQALNQRETVEPLLIAEPDPECPACDCAMRFIGSRGLCLIWVCRTCGHALIRRTEDWQEELEESGALPFMDELIG